MLNVATKSKIVTHPSKASQKHAQRIPQLVFYQLAQIALPFMSVSIFTYYSSFSLPDSQGGVCDILAYSIDSHPSSWSTIASPRFNVYERDRSCDELNSLNLNKEEPSGRVLTGKIKEQNLG